MSMNSDTQIDPQAVINDLLEQMKRLTLDNSMLRAYINSNSAADSDAPPAAAMFDNSDDE
jgi:hypothetical protein